MVFVWLPPSENHAKRLPLPINLPIYKKKMRAHVPVPFPLYCTASLAAGGIGDLLLKIKCVCLRLLVVPF